jgi:hypothetical protein
VANYSFYNAFCYSIDPKQQVARLVGKYVKYFLIARDLILNSNAHTRLSMNKKIQNEVVCIALLRLLKESGKTIKMLNLQIKDAEDTIKENLDQHEKSM